MCRPDDLRVLHHAYHDGWCKHTVIVALFVKAPRPADVPKDWYLATTREIIPEEPFTCAYLRHFPYGTTVVNGQIVA